MDTILDLPIPRSKTWQTVETLRKTLADILGISEREILPSSRFDAIINRRARRQVWDEMRSAGFDLPPLELASETFFAVAIVVLAPLGLLAYFIQWSFLLTVAEVSFVARKVTRPWAVHPPLGCQTIRQAAIALTPFALQDYRAGLWPREEIADKVRLALAMALAVPFESVTEETRFLDLLEC